MGRGVRARVRGRVCMREGGGVGFPRELLLTTFVDSDTYANESKDSFSRHAPFRFL